MTFCNHTECLPFLPEDRSEVNNVPFFILPVIKLSENGQLYTT